MDYKSKIQQVLFVALLCFHFLSCTNKEKSNIENTFYVEILNSPDSLKTKLTNAFSGKTSYYKNNKIVIVSLNYLTEDHPDMHYFKNIAELKEPIKDGVNKIQIEFSGNFTEDSTFYGLKEFRYKDKKWVGTSNIGIIKAMNTDISAPKTRPIRYHDLTKQVLKNAVEGTY